jgi:cysteine desulfurase / selenocysteine lyase
MLDFAASKLEEIPGLRIIGTAKNKASVISFVIDGVNSLDIGIMLDTMGIAVRTGQHCTEPLITRLGLTGTVRASFALYNTLEEVDLFIAGLKKVLKLLK